MVDYVQDAGEMARRVRAFAFGPDVPVEIAERLQLMTVTADLITLGADIMYAHYDLLNDDGKRVVGELFTHAANQDGWDGFNEGDRSKKIVDLVAKELGDKAGKVPESDKWPEPKNNLRQNTDWRMPEPEPLPEPEPQPEPDPVLELELPLDKKVPTP